MSDIGDPKVVNDARSRAGVGETDRRVVWKTLLGDARGRDFIWWLLSGANIYASTYRGDPLASAFEEGKRAFMIPIQAEIIAADPASYTKMVSENAVREFRERFKEIENE